MLTLRRVQGTGQAACLLLSDCRGRCGRARADRAHSQGFPCGMAPKQGPQTWPPSRALGAGPGVDRWSATVALSPGLGWVSQSPWIRQGEVTGPGFSVSSPQGLGLEAHCWCGESSNVAVLLPSWL